MRCVYMACAVLHTRLVRSSPTLRGRPWPGTGSADDLALDVDTPALITGAIYSFRIPDSSPKKKNFVFSAQFPSAHVMVPAGRSLDGDPP